MPTLYNEKDRNVRLTWAYLVGFLVFIIGIGWIFSQAMGNSYILYGAVIFAVLMNFFSYWFSDKIVLAMNGAKEVSRENAREIYNLVENLCITAGLPVPKIYIIEDSSPNAFATGRNPEHAVVALTTGLIDKLDKTELEGVIAHELSHIGNRDILLGTVVTVLVGFVALLSDFFLRWSIFGGLSGGDSDNKGGQAQLIITIAALVLAILAPIAAIVMQLAISRKREYLADADGALLTRYPDGLASALEKISQDTAGLKKANKATAHMYIANPLKGKRAKGFTAKLFMTHPPVEERIKKLRGMASSDSNS
ncbi:MAG: M48 family metallopeptidase [Candidatus Moranbacteria bacterium]|nr:M48 family metallopeptidase [Candidatus Moranbacteria bacterium]